MIHVCFGLHDKTGRYAKFTGTAMLSLFDNTNAAVTVHILHDNTLNADNRDKFAYVAGRYGQLVKFYNVDTLCADKIATMVSLVPTVKNSHVSVGAFYRLLISQILPPDVEKIIYLDSDIAINRDINELWQVNLNGKILAAVSEGVCGTDTNSLFLCTSGLIKHEEYFNSGVMLVDLRQLRKEEKTIIEGAAFRGAHPQCICFDQDILNYCFAKRSLKLSSDFNVFVVHARTRKETVVGRKIYHYAGDSSFNLDRRDTLNQLWLSYFARTPWFDAETIGRLYEGFQQVHVSLKQAMIQISALMSGKTRAFFAAPNNIDVLKKLFSIRNDEKIIPAENQESLQKLLDTMKKARGKKVFFILLPGFPYQILTEAGFTAGKDFVNGLEFLSEAQGVPLNSHQLLKAM